MQDIAAAFLKNTGLLWRGGPCLGSQRVLGWERDPAAESGWRGQGTHRRSGWPWESGRGTRFS